MRQQGCRARCWGARRPRPIPHPTAAAAACSSSRMQGRQQGAAPTRQTARRESQRHPAHAGRANATQHTQGEAHTGGRGCARLRLPCLLVAPPPPLPHPHVRQAGRVHRRVRVHFEHLIKLAHLEQQDAVKVAGLELPPLGVRVGGGRVGRGCGGGAGGPGEAWKGALAGGAQAMSVPGSGTQPARWAARQSGGPRA